MTRIGLIDYGMGNLHSVQRAFERLGAEVIGVQAPEQMTDCQALVLPGVGAFDPAMERLQASGLVPAIQAWCSAARPLLGICLGLQLLFESSDEGEARGLGLLKGHIAALPRVSGYPIPHMGWEPLQRVHPSPLFPEGEEAGWVYFVHSFAAEPQDPHCVTTSVRFADRQVTAAVWSGSVGACQFHPEKSGVAGEQILRRWLRWVEQRP
ncbi:imidazole glycerol phosphate synthase subunit HisH [Vulcanococcus sp.]|jgi:glutamine amidotransferase|uniref:imidazole glycerol phosphate synthase subunit HisH n=1 Tax=Vulcanococcus sp. TaxID=2856995 RepID=UPI0032249CDF